MTKVNTLFFPDFDQNQYTENIYKIIESIDDVHPDRVNSLPFSLLKRGFHHYDFVVVNWLESGLVDTKKRQLTFRTVLRFILRVFVLKFIAKKLIYFRHNIYPHALHGRHGKLATKITDFACNLADHSIAHSGHLGVGYEYVPHPLYRFEELYGNSPARISNRYVIFGRIIEYKAIDKLLELWNQVPLLITGSVGSQHYVEQLIKLKKDRNLDSVEIDARFLSNSEAQSLVSSSRGLILSHSDDDMIVSGSFFFAASLGVPVFAIKTPFLTWLKVTFDYSGLFVFNDLTAMIYALNSTDFETIDRWQISQEAQQLFGDSIIKQALEKVFT